VTEPTAGDESRQNSENDAAMRMAEEFLDAYDRDDEDWDEALSALGQKYGAGRGESVLAAMFRTYAAGRAR
jgi:hypothetical protein